MIHFSTILTLIRGPLAFLFLVDSVFWKTTAIVLAMISDSIDGYFARRYNTVSQLGTILDPLMDKFFVSFIVGVFLWEGTLNWWEAMALLSRDIAIFFFGLFLWRRGCFQRFKFQSVISGKLTTALQFFVLISLTLRLHVPSYVYAAFIVLGCTFWGELYLIKDKNEQDQN